MFGLKYLSNDKKQLLSKLQERLTRVKDQRVKNDTELDIQQILSEAKPYQTCDLMEADELRSQLLQQIRTLQGLGKIQSVETFQMHLRDVEYYIQTRRMEEDLKEQWKQDHPQTQGPNLKEGRTTSLSDLDREKKKKRAAFGRTRWTIDMKEEHQEDD